MVYNDDGTPVQMYWSGGDEGEGTPYVRGADGEMVQYTPPATPITRAWTPADNTFHSGYMGGRSLQVADNDGGGVDISLAPDFDPYAYRNDPSLPPTLSDFYNAWNKTHIDQYGVAYNRPWAKHGETGLRDQFVNQYTDAIEEYNQLYGTNYTPNQNSIEAFSQAPTAFAAYDPSERRGKRGLGGLVDFLGPILPIGLAVFGMPWLSPILGTVGAGAVLGATGSALTGGDGGDILKGAVLGGLGGAASGIGGDIGKALTGSTVSASTATAIGNATISGAKTLIQGGDLSDVLSSAVVSGASSVAGGYAGDFVGSAVGDSLGSTVAADALKNAANAAARTVVSGGDLEQAGTAALMGGFRTAAGAGWNALKNADFDNSGGSDDSSGSGDDDDSFGWVSGEELPTGEYNAADWVSGEELPTGDYNLQKPGWVSGEELPTGNYNLPPEVSTSGRTPSAGGASAPRPTAPPAQSKQVPQTASQQGPSFDMLMQLASSAPAAAPQVNVQGPAPAMIPGWNPVSTPYGGPSLFASGGSVPDMYAVNQELLRMLRG